MQRNEAIPIAISILVGASLTRLPLSMAYPFGAISYILVFIGSALSGEYIHPARYLGVILIVLGILIIGSISNNSKA